VHLLGHNKHQLKSEKRKEMDDDDDGEISAFHRNNIAEIYLPSVTERG